MSQAAEALAIVRCPLCRAFLISAPCHKRGWGAKTARSREGWGPGVQLGRGVERDSVYSRLFDATPPTVRDCVNDFDTAKLRRGVQACP